MTKLNMSLKKRGLRMLLITFAIAFLFWFFFLRGREGFDITKRIPPGYTSKGTPAQQAVPSQTLMPGKLSKNLTVPSKTISGPVAKPIRP